MIREIVLDTETTGFEPSEGHRLVEIGCVELINHLPSGKTYHQYINPEREVPAEAAAIHGLTQEILKNEPVFSQIYTDFLEFIGNGKLIIHNAEFDMKFLNAELKCVGHKGLWARNDVLDTLALARKKFPGSPANLDALCRRFSIDNSNRTLHGALLDSELLAEVYLELIGGRQRGLTLSEEEKASAAGRPISKQAANERVIREPRLHTPSEEELAAHEKLLEELSEPLWGKAS